jgi:hypothetical protein
LRLERPWSLSVVGFGIAGVWHDFTVFSFMTRVERQTKAFRHASLSHVPEMMERQNSACPSGTSNSGTRTPPMPGARSGFVGWLSAIANVGAT